ncbi:MAG: hypothetical protein L6R39_002690 [Caloplaca ligustica]|nr:MAG: hypothetical protein L6R39_002690 [Caloplaca ligustica]
MSIAAHSAHFPGTAEALRKVFLPYPILPAIQRPQRIVFRRHFPNVQRRNAWHLSPLSANGTPQPQNTGPPRDEAIAAREVQVVDPDGGALQPPRSLRDALASIDRRVDFLVQVGDKIHPRYAHLAGPEAGGQDTRPRIPVCKAITKAQYRQAQAEKLRPKKDASALVKEVDVNWAMSQNDLNHRLKRLKDFLDDGRRVEVAFGKRKRKGWMQRKDVTDEEANSIVKQVRRAVQEVEGAKEWKEMEGKVRGELVMFFEAKREKPEVKKKYEGEYKVKKKFQAAHEEKMGGYYSPAVK